MNILKVTPGDIPRIVALQEKHILKEKDDPANGGFLVSAFTAEDYERFLAIYSYFYKAVADDGTIAGVLLGLKSSEIQPGDLNNRLLTEAVRGGCVIVKQVFTDPAAGRKGVGGELYRHLFRQVEDGVPVVAAVVDDPPNPPSIAFHRKQGFRPFMEFTPDPDRDGVTRRRTGWVREPEGVTDIVRHIRTFTGICDEQGGTEAETVRGFYEGAKEPGNAEVIDIKTEPDKDCGCGSGIARTSGIAGNSGVTGNSVTDALGSAAGIAGGNAGGIVDGDAEGIADGSAERPTEGFTDGFYPDKPKMDSDRMNALLSLYRHEDNLNWRKLGLQFTVIFTLLAAFFVIDERSESMPFDEDAVKTILTLICLTINICFALKIVSGLCYMDRHKKQAVKLDEEMEAKYGLHSLFRNIQKRSITSKLIEWMAWAGVLVSFGFLAVASYPLMEWVIGKCGICEEATLVSVLSIDAIIAAGVTLLARHYRAKVKTGLCPECEDCK